MSDNCKMFEKNSKDINKDINKNITENMKENISVCNVDKKCLECDAYNFSQREEWYKSKLSENGLYYNYTDADGQEGSVRIFEYTFPMLKDIANRTLAEEDILSKMLETINSKKLNENLDIYEEVYDEYADIGEAAKVLKGVPVIVKNSYKVHSDYTSEKVNVINNKRFTTDVPDKFDNTIYIFGKSGVYGYGVEDSDTIASKLQNFINERYDKKLRVVNCGVAAISDVEIRHNIESIDYKPGDIIVNIVLKRRCYDEENKGCNLSRRYTDLLPLFNETQNRKTMFVDSVPHLNGRGNELIADKICGDILDYLATQNVREDATIKAENISVKEKTDNANVTVNDNSKEKTGAIVMNCNPFTLGHRYLIETAKKQVDKLYVFVVEEDKSVFKFKDRIELVRLGTKDLENVLVLPSGRFMISSLTFPEYFKKETEKNVVIDSSLDLQLFGEEVAKKYNISIRFAGEEPNDAVTRQYNRNMEEMLPKYGIEFREIKRVTTEGEVISATTVRECLKNGDYARLKKLVPDTTYNWLANNGYME